ncbi:hypothetical protein Bca52824_028644 [Brassica carinata]|uniref:Uncharacterized protein n=1 Tax=Brassica carinata TaxID=52824 RepID=A0A8X7VCK7_BRACI|nr:hypothetical protein Bca52824_028644 [Brassica carinata]
MEPEPVPGISPRVPAVLRLGPQSPLETRDDSQLENAIFEHSSEKRTRVPAALRLGPQQPIIEGEAGTSKLDTKRKPGRPPGSRKILQSPGKTTGTVVKNRKDEGLDVISEGLDALKNLARDMNEVPIPAIILDQLHHFATYNDDTDSFQFQWYSNVFSLSIQDYNKLNRIGPQLCGSLFATPQQTASARAFWRSVFSGATRVNAADETARFTSVLNLFGFKKSRTNWFQHTCIVMHNYSKYFNGSVPLSSILPTGLGAVAVRGVPSVDEATRSFLYPTDAEIEPFTSSRFHPRRQIPSALSMTFQHCEYDGLDEKAERYATVAHTNLRWPLENEGQNEWTRVNSCVTHRGDVWSFMCHRFLNPVVNLHFQLGQVIVSRYHLHEIYLEF